MSLTEEDMETRSRILGCLYKRRKKFPKKPDAIRKDMLKELRLEETVLDTHIKILSENYLVYIQTPMPNLVWTHAHITSKGAAQYEKEPPHIVGERK